MISSRTLKTIALGAATVLLAAAPAAAQAPEGITVHGDWVIEVHNVDGSLAVRREFRNALQPQGKADLATLLGRGAPLGFWRVNTTNTTGVCLAGTEYCSLREGGDNLSAGGLPFNHSVTVAVVGDEAVLSANFVAAADGQITAVSTQLMFPTSNATFFSATGLSAPVPVQATQSVSLRVAFSFQ